VQILSGSAATMAGINDFVVNWLAKKALPDDLIFVYVSSVMNSNAHGDPLLFSYDTLGSESELSGINLREFLIELKRRTQSHYILCALDTSPAPGSKGVDLQQLADTGVAVLSATDGHQPSLNNGVTGSSVFIHHLGEAISLEGGHYSLEQVFDHVSKCVSNDAEVAFKTHQTPLLLVTDKTIAEHLELGAPTRVPTAKQSISFGHPLNRLALDHPEMIPPLEGGSAKTVSIKSKALSSKPALAAGTPVKGKAEDDEDAPHQHVDFGAYLDKMKVDIQKHWSPPKGLENRHVVTAFTIMKDGRVIDAHVVDGSGIAEVDQSALDALKAASPLDPLPSGAPGSVDIKYKFDWQVKRD
jgi:TonB family protein